MLAHVLAALLGLALLLVVLQDAFEVMLLPRRVQRRVRLVRLFFSLGWRAWSTLGMRLPAGAARERLLSVFGPLSMVALFTLWAVGFVIAFGLMLWGTSPPPVAANQPSELVDLLYLSGVTFFTLGYGDLVPHGTLPRFLAIAEAGTGFSLIAMVISYLPVLYQLFARREAHVILLDSRAGSPPTAGSLLRLHSGAEGAPQIHQLLQAWEIWAADLLESHLSYPMLAYYRSQHDNQSWLAAVAAVMDTCALVLVASEGQALLQARMTFAMLRQLILEMTRSFAIPVPRDVANRLDAAGLTRLTASVTAGNPSWRLGPEAADLLSALRGSYEPLLATLSAYLLLPLPGWTPDESAVDHWDQGARGTLARRLIDELSSSGVGDEPRAESAWRRLRSRLRLPAR